MKLLLLTPPLVQPNTPYPAMPHLLGFLEGRGLEVEQRDLSAKVLRDILLEYGDETTDELLELLSGPAPVEAKRGASEAIEDLARWIRDNVDSEFGFARYAEKSVVAARGFTEIERLVRRRGVLDRPLERRLREAMDETRPDAVAVTCPFPGMLVAAFKIAKWIRRHAPNVRLMLGGGFVSTELREMTDRRPYRYFDEFQFDEGYGNFGWMGQRSKVKGQTTENRFHCLNSDLEPLTLFVRPSYRGIDWDDCFDVVETENPVANLWNAGRWIKLVMARGCYWHKCAFCDVKLPYIGCFKMPKAAEIVDAMEALCGRTPPRGRISAKCATIPRGRISAKCATILRGRISAKCAVQFAELHPPEILREPRFHFADEAMPPVLVKGVCEEIIRRKFRCEWWGNVRFDAAYTPTLARLMAKAGCVAVTGGLECANDRLLGLMNKGITLAGARRVLTAFARAGIAVHAYLMYGFPTETADEAYGALETVRGLFRDGLVQSAFWHRFALTVHSPIARDPARFGLTLAPPPKKGARVFMRNEIAYEEPGAPDWTAIGADLALAQYNYNQGRGLDRPWAHFSKWAHFREMRGAVHGTAPTGISHNGFKKGRKRHGKKG